MNVHNIMEEQVFKRVNEMYGKLAEERPSWLSCDCENCRLDAISYVLNRIPPRYVVSGRGMTHIRSDHSADQMRADIDALSLEGIRLVSSTKRPYHDKAKSAPAVRDSEIPLYNFPIFTGQVFDGSTFEPLARASVLLKLDGKAAAMQDMTWQNPSPTFGSTRGNYTFWVAPESADGIEIPRTFNFTLEIEAPEYDMVVYSFEVPLVSEKRDRTELNSTYSLKIQDLFLFKACIKNEMED